MRKRAWPFGQGISLMLEAQQVIALRTMKLAMGGPAAQAEARRMIDEKVCATVEAARLITIGVARGDGTRGAADTVRMLRRKVRANRKRLTGSS